MESIVSTFHIDWKIILAQAINFGVVFVVFYLFALKPLTKLMQDRASKIAKGLDDAKANASTLEKTNKEYGETLVKARAEANDIFQKGKKEAEAKKSEMLEQARSEVTTMIESGKKTLETEKVKMVAEAKNELASLATLAAEKIMAEKNK